MTDLLTIVLVVLLAILVAGALSPLESLHWWAGWSGDRKGLDQQVAESRAQGREVSPDARYYVVFLSGIGTISGEELLPDEQGLVEDLRRDLPPGGVVTDVFPYAVDGNPLTGQRTFAWFWRLMRRIKVRISGNLTGIINLRNGYYVVISADGRYGPVFNYGLSREVLKALLRVGYDPDQRRPVFLLGYSGGGQMAVGAASYLKRTLDAPVETIALGGVISADPGLTRIDKLTRIYGTKDPIQAIGDWFLPPRLPNQLNATWARSKREGRVELVSIGRITHVGSGSYLETEPPFEDGDTPRGRSIAAIRRAVERRLATPG